MSQVLRQSRPTLQGDTEDYNENNAELVRSILQEASQDFIAGRRAAERQSLREIRERNTPSTAMSDAGEQTVIVREQPAPTNPPAASVPSTNSDVWTTSNFDISQQPNMVNFQHSPHATQFGHSQSYVLPTRNADSGLSQQQSDTGGYDQSIDFGYSPLTHDGFGIDFVNDAEFQATLEDPEMYSGHSVDIHNMDNFVYPEASSRREP